MGILWVAPNDWVEEPPNSSMRQAQWRVPGDSGDAECVVFYFGPNQGGDAMMNAQRWAGQFTLSDGRPGVDGAVLVAREAAGMAVLTVEVEGTYNPGMPFAGRPTEERSGQMLLGAIVEGPDANWFVKCTGPKATLSGARTSFDEFIGSMHRGRAPVPTS